MTQSHLFDGSSGSTEREPAFTCDPSVPSAHVKMLTEKIEQHSGWKMPPFSHVISTVQCRRRDDVVVARLTMFDGAYAELEIFPNGTLKDGSTVWGCF